MRILQLIDSLELGGAERMAISFANSIQEEVGFSALVATRAEGPLRAYLNPEVEYLFIKKTKAIDFGAIKRLKQFCVLHQIDTIQAHSTSYFTAVLLKWAMPKLRIIWHNHYGNSLKLKGIRLRALQFCSNWFDGMIACNPALLTWGQHTLRVKKSIYLPNYTEGKDAVPPQTILKGQDGKRVLLLGNLRPEKNHPLLLDCIETLQNEFPDWTYHFVGKDTNDAYSDSLKSQISTRINPDTVFLYGSCPDSHAIIQQAEICVLCSVIEGLPVALIEYGFHGKAVVVTAVGEMPNVVIHQKNGFLAASNDKEALTSHLRVLLTDSDCRKELGNALQATIHSGYAATSIMNQYMKWLQQV